MQLSIAAPTYRTLDHMKQSAHTSFFAFTAFIGVLTGGGVSVCS